MLSPPPRYAADARARRPGSSAPSNAPRRQMPVACPQRRSALHSRRNRHSQLHCRSSAGPSRQCARRRYSCARLQNCPSAPLADQHPGRNRPASQAFATPSAHHNAASAPEQAHCLRGLRGSPSHQGYTVQPDRSCPSSPTRTSLNHLRAENIRCAASGHRPDRRRVCTSAARAFSDQSEPS